MFSGTQAHMALDPGEDGAETEPQFPCLYGLGRLCYIAMPTECY
jgi:hypothetical protein